jgi:hypothetical protein
LILQVGLFPTPYPQPGDLLRILDGINGPSSFYRIILVTPNSVTIEWPLSNPSVSGFQFLVTSGNNIINGSFTVMNGTVLTDPSGQFVTSGVKPGYTVVLTNILHLNSRYQRRQVVSVTSETQIVVDYPFVGYVLPETYRIYCPLNTFSDISSLVLYSSTLLQVLRSNPNSEIASSLVFFDNVFTYKFTSPISGTFSGNVLTAPGVDFEEHDVRAGDYVYVSYTQNNAGIYLITEIVSASVLKVKDVPVAGNVTCQIASAFSTSETSLKDVFSIGSNSNTFSNSVSSWYSLISTSISVVGSSGIPDPTYFARGFLPVDISSWYNSVVDRQGYIPEVITKLETILASSDKLYDKRYAWIDARINLEKGILVQQQRAAANRIKAQNDILNQLIKLLAVQ